MRFLFSLKALVPADAHSVLFSQIASHGIIVVGVWKIGSTTDTFDPAWFAATVDFVETKLERSLHNQEGTFYIYNYTEHVTY